MSAADPDRPLTKVASVGIKFSRAAGVWLFTRRITQYLLPTPTALFVNSLLVRNPPPPRLASSDWANRERRAMLERSLDRLRIIEAKEPGLATISAILAAAVGLALASRWHDSTGLGQALLILAAVYAGLSLLTPIYLVGPQRRFVLDGALADAAGTEDPEGYLGEKAGELWSENSARVTKLTNLQNASRNELVIGLIALVLWALLGPVSGTVIKNGGSANHSDTPTARVAQPQVVPREPSSTLCPRRTLPAE